MEAHGEHGTSTSVNRALGRAENTSSENSPEPGRTYGDVFALHGLWRDSGVDKVLNRATVFTRIIHESHDILYWLLNSGPGKAGFLVYITGTKLRRCDFSILHELSWSNRLCAPDGKLGCLRWLETAAMPVIPKFISHQHLLRAMDALVDHLDVFEEAIARQIRPLVNQDLTVVFYDLTTVRIHGKASVNGDLRAYGMNKEMGKPARQFVLGSVQTVEGLPLFHTVHSVILPETRTLRAMVQTVL